jgi:hypothetical protein
VGSGRADRLTAGQALAERDKNLGIMYLREAANPLHQSKQVVVI